MENHLKDLMINYHQYAYIILFFWCIIEGEIALILAGLMAHQGHISLPIAIICAAAGATCGDQINFFIGKYNKNYITKKLANQKRKLAIAHLMLKKYGWSLIFIQRYMYGFRTIIPISIGLAGYSQKKFTIINFLSAVVWAGFIITTTWYLGDRIWQIIGLLEKYWYVSIGLVIIIVMIITFLIIKTSRSIADKISQSNI